MGDKLVFLFIHIRIKCLPICRVVCVLYWHWRVEPVASVIVVYDDAAFQMLVNVFLRLHVFEESIVLLGSIGVAILGLRVEEEYLTVFHADDEIHIEERFISLAVGIGYGIVLATLVAILIPPVDVLLVCLQESLEVFLWLGRILQFHEWQEGMVVYIILDAMALFLVKSLH